MTIRTQPPRLTFSLQRMMLAVLLTVLGLTSLRASIVETIEYGPGIFPGILLMAAVALICAATLLIAPKLGQTLLSITLRVGEWFIHFLSP